MLESINSNDTESSNYSMMNVHRRLAASTPAWSDLVTIGVLLCLLMLLLKMMLNGARNFKK